MSNYARIESNTTQSTPLNSPIAAPNQNSINVFNQKMSAVKKNETLNIKAEEFYKGLNQSQHTKILTGIRKDVMVEMKKLKSQMKSIETLDKNYLKLLSDFKELQALHIKYSPASVLSQGVSITKTLAGKIPNAFGAGVGVINRLSNLSEFKVEGFIYDDPLSDHYHAGFNAFDHDGNGFIFLRIDGLN